MCEILRSHQLLLLQVKEQVLLSGSLLTNTRKTCGHIFHFNFMTHFSAIWEHLIELFDLGGKSPAQNPSLQFLLAVKTKKVKVKGLQQVAASLVQVEETTKCGYLQSMISQKAPGPQLFHCNTDREWSDIPPRPLLSLSSVTSHCTLCLAYFFCQEYWS